MKKYVYPLMIILSGFMITNLDAQDETKKIKVKIIKNENGEEKVIEKTFHSVEEMKNDPEMASLPIEPGTWMNNDDIVVYKLDSTEEENHIFIDTRKNEEKDAVVSVRKLKDGETQIIRNSQVIELTGEAGRQIKVIMNADSDSVENSEKGYSFKYRSDGDHHWVNRGDDVIVINDSLITDSNEDRHRVFVVKSEGDHHSNQDFIIKEDNEGNKIEITIKSQTITIQDFEPKDEDVSGFDLKGKRSLELDDLNYYPNPNSGKFTLYFKANPVATEIRIVNMEGRLLYNEMLPDFTGMYSRQIDLTDVKPGIYILQLIQGKEALNKKLVVE